MTWCSGCSLFKAKFFIEKYLEKYPTILVSGIGCSGRITSIIKSNKQKIHTLHGRACSVASGISIFEKTIVFSGDGDLLDIGASGTLHAKERNDNIRVVCLNNNVYAMTGRQKRKNKSGFLKYIITQEVDISDTKFETILFDFLNEKGFGFLNVTFKCLKEKWK